MEVQVPSFDWNEILAPWVESTEPRPSTSVDIQGQQLQVTNVLDLDEAQLDKIQSEMKPKTTIRTENGAINRFNGNWYYE